MVHVFTMNQHDLACWFNNIIDVDILVIMLDVDIIILDIDISKSHVNIIIWDVDIYISRMLT